MIRNALSFIPAILIAAIIGFVSVKGIEKVTHDQARMDRLDQRF
jgi:uncharacterized membrane protein (DUF106 family)